MFILRLAASVVLCLALLLTSCATKTPQPVTIPTRDQIADQYKWKLEDIYATDELWEQDFTAISQAVPSLQKYQGKLGESAATLLSYLKLEEDANKRLGKLYVYARMRKDEDLTVSKYQAMADRAGSLSTEINTATAFVRPELLAIDDSKMAEFLQNKDLKPYQMLMDNIVRLKPHTLPGEEEKLFALSQDVMGSPETIYNFLTGADFTWPLVKDENGKEVELSYERYAKMLDSPDRQVRETGYNSYLIPYKQYTNTLSSLYATQVKAHIFNAKARVYDSALAAALDGPNIPAVVYDNLVNSVRNNLEPLHNWTALKKKALKIEELHPWDVFVPVSPGTQRYYTLEEAKTLIKAALKPLGPDYLAKLEEGFNSGWIDFYATANKTSGAYSWGSYGTHPYVLLNFGEKITFDDVSTLAHEMGHAMHSYYSDLNQPFTASASSTFVAEVASITNQVLLMNYMLNNASPKEKLPLLEKYITLITGTFYTQTRYAEFEKATHDKAENGESLTPELLSSLWSDLYQQYMGSDMKINDNTGYGWASIPHFYYNFYVYNYATSMCAAEALSQKLLAGDQKAVEAYLGFLSSGSSRYPIDILKGAGIDMTTSAPIDSTSRKMGELVAGAEAILSGK